MADLHDLPWTPSTEDVGIQFDLTESGSLNFTLNWGNANPQVNVQFYWNASPSKHIRVFDDSTWENVTDNVYYSNGSWVMEYYKSQNKVYIYKGGSLVTSYTFHTSVSAAPGISYSIYSGGTVSNVKAYDIGGGSGPTGIQTLNKGKWGEQ